MQNTLGAKCPDSDTDWQAIDIFVFSNGQQHSPPRKYHLQTEDINLWKSTLNFLAKTQYGPFHSTVDLYTMEGTRITNPLELSNGGSYVAVQPPDSFIYAGYDKYLIKASRSWEKRRTRKNDNNLESDQFKPISDMENIPEVIESAMVKTNKASKVLDKIASTVMNQDASTIIKPHLMSALPRNPMNATKAIEKKKISIQPPFLVKKITPTTLPDLRNNSFKIKDSLKLTNGMKITRPEVYGRSSVGSSNSVPYSCNKFGPKNKSFRLPHKAKDSSLNPSKIRPNDQEIMLSGMNTPAAINSLVVNKNETLATTVNSNLQNVIEDKDLLSVANIYENPQRELPSIAIIPDTMRSILFTPVRQTATTALINETGCNDDTTKSNNKIVSLKNDTNDYGSDFLESINITHNLDKNMSQENFLDEKLLSDQKTILKTGETNGNILEVCQTNIPEFEKPKFQDLPPRKRSVTIDESAEETKEEVNVVNTISNHSTNKVTASSRKSIESIQVNCFPTKLAVMSNTETENHLLSQKTQETNNLISSTTDKIISDNYKASVRQGDVISLKFNIEIESSNGGFLKPNDTLNSQFITVIKSEKESQSNIDNQFIAQNKPLTTLIRNKIKEPNSEDNNGLIVVQCGNCKFCNDLHAVTHKEINDNYIILLPIEKCKESNERCRCSQTYFEIQKQNIEPALQSISKNSKIDLEQLALDTSTHNANPNLIPESKQRENPVTFIRKKSVVISNESNQPKSRESSIIIFQEIDVKSDLLDVNLDAMGKIMKKEEKSTQTEWCDVLLEVNLLCDGHYSFRLPALELLKQHNLT